MSTAEAGAGEDGMITRRAVTAGLLLALAGLSATGCSGVGYEAACAREGQVEGSPGMARCIEAKRAATRHAHRRSPYRRPPRSQGAGG